MTKEEKRKHGMIFSNKNEVKEILFFGEKAVVVKKRGEVLLYGTPSRDEEEIAKLKTGAEVIYNGNSDSEVSVLSTRVPF